MSTGGGTTTTNTVQKSDPWAPAQPYLQDIMSQAQQVYNSQQGQNAYAPFNTVVQPSATTQRGLDLTAQRALNGSPVVDAAKSGVTDIMNGTSAGSSTLQDLTGGYGDPGASYTQAGTGANAATGYATNFANGGGPGSSTIANWADPNSINPYLTEQYNAASKPVIDSINAQFSQAGRTGSTANQDQLARNLGDLSANIFSTGYENAANRSLSAAQSQQSNALQGTSLLGNYSTDQYNRNLTAGSQLSSDAANQANVRGNAANNLNGQTLQAASLAPTLANQDYTDLQNLLNVGGAQDAQSQAQIQDLLTRWQYQQQQPWNILQQYGGAVSGLGGLMPSSSSGTSSQTTPSQSLIPSLIGGGISLASLFSDRNLKTDIQRVGTADNGLPLYLFRYKGDNQTRLGLMAQDVEKTNPEAVEMDPSGFKRVNYQLALAA